MTLQCKLMKNTRMLHVLTPFLGWFFVGGFCAPKTRRYISNSVKDGAAKKKKKNVQCKM